MYDETSMSRNEISIVAQHLFKERDYWLEKLSGELVKAYFPYDLNHNEIRSSVSPKMKGIHFSISGNTWEKLMTISKGSNTKIYMLLVSSLLVLLYRYTGNNDIIIGTPTFRKETKGKFLNYILALRNQVDGEISFKNLLMQVRQCTLEAGENQEYPLELLIPQLNIEKENENSSPLFSIALLLENLQDKSDLGHSNLDILLSFNKGDRGIDCLIEYNCLLYKKSSIERLINHFRYLIDQALLKVDCPLAKLGILPLDERRQILINFNNTKMNNIFSGQIQRIFEMQVDRAPDNIASIGKTRVKSLDNNKHLSIDTSQLSYFEMNAKSNQLAKTMINRGVTRNSLVSIMIEPSLEMIITLLAILKAGGCYLPIEQTLPWDRIQYILEDSNTSTLISTSKVMESIPFTSLQGLETCQDVLIKCTPPRPHINSFDDLSWPDRTQINLRNYKNKIGMASVTNCISIQSTRGCPYHCLYCHKIWSKNYVHRSAENIFNEIEYYYKNGVSNFAFIDDCFNLGRDNSSRLFQLIIQNGLILQLFFPNGLRGDIMTRDYIDLMVEAGTSGINLSLETASPRLQKLLKKNLNLDKFKQVMDYIAGSHPNVILEMASMHGFPGETEEEALMTLDFIKNIHWLHFPYIHILKIFPNTEMEAFALEEGISKKDIMKSKDRAFHELPETLPFPKSFTRKYQSDFLNNYFLSKERLTHVLPYQTKILSEDALVQKYNAYLPVEINSIDDVIRFAKLENVQIPKDYGIEEKTAGSIFDLKIKKCTPDQGAKRILFLDLSQHFSTHHMLYRVVEQPLGLIYLVTFLKQKFGAKIDGRIYKSGNDFDSFEELKSLLDKYKPHMVGIRSLTFFQEFFHETVSLIRQWGIDVPIIVGGPYASSDYDTILKDKNVDLAILGEGEHTLAQLIEEMLGNGFQLPDGKVLEKIRGIAYKKAIKTNDLSREVILMDRLRNTIDEKEFENLSLPECQNQLAYVMYTSGSTGRPKGVLIQHNQVNNCISWMQSKFNLKPRDVIVNRTDLTFDPSVWEIFWPLYIGGKVKVLNRHQQKNAEFLLQIMTEDLSITMMYCPATLVNIMSYLLDSKKVKPYLRMPWLIIGAEPISMDTVKNFYKYYQGKIVNTYGPTECTINNTYYEIPIEDKRTVVPIGKPIDNNMIYILDNNSQLTPLKIPGQIYISGSSVARGYLNNPEMTHEKFNDDFWVAPSSHDEINKSFCGGQGSSFYKKRPLKAKGKKIYRTGDIGRWLEDGTIEIKGRIDDQIKVRGYRIEPAEIENALLSHPLIKECTVVVKKNQPDKQQIKKCRNCGITTKYPQVIINDQGECNICELYKQKNNFINGYFKNLQQLKQLIKDANTNPKSQYDCLLLYAGGKGAAYALYRLVEMGIKVLATTYDTGYFGKAHLKNIKKITASLGVDHIVLTHPRSDHILKESIKVAATVCRGCFHTSSSLAAEYAFKHNIPIVVGATLSRGQIIENKVLMFLQQGLSSIEDLEKEISNLQRNTPAIDRSIFDYIDIDLVKSGAVHKKVKFFDFYRFCDISNREIIAYLDNQDTYWKSRRNDAIYSTNCPIKQMGDFAHLKEKGFHYYGAATSWEKRLEHISLKNIEEDLNIKISKGGYEKFLKRIGYQEKMEDISAKDPRQYICAYYAYDDNKILSEASLADEITEKNLREFLLEKFPAYMMPYYFIKLKNLPLTSNGKVDKAALPDPQLSRTKRSATYVAPKNDLEKFVAGIWRDVLNVNEVGTDDNFFDLGGSSLDIVTMGIKIKEHLNKDISIVTLFTYPTISSFANYLNQDDNDERNTNKNVNSLIKTKKGKSMMRPSVIGSGGDV